MHLWKSVAVVVMFAAAGTLGGCGGPEEHAHDAGTGTDAGTGQDGGGHEHDAGATDAGETEDAGMDAGTDAGTQPPVSFRNDVQPIFNALCIGCHPGTGGFSLTAASAYNQIVGVDMVGACRQMARVQPNDPDNSGLYRRVTGNTCGARMPTSGAPLTPQQQATLRTWISEGARNN